VSEETYELHISQRKREADEDAREPPTTPTGGGTQGAQYRHGVAKIIDASDGDGTYTITEQQWDATGAEWIDGTAPACLVEADARDVSERTTGVADQFVPFWEQRKVGGGIDILIDVGDGADEYTFMVSGNDTTPGYHEAKVVGTADVPDYVNVSWETLNDGGNETRRIKIAESDVQITCGAVLYRYWIDVQNNGDILLDSGDFRGRICRAWMFAHALIGVDVTPSDADTTTIDRKVADYTLSGPSCVTTDHTICAIASNSGNLKIYIDEDGAGAAAGDLRCAGWAYCNRWQCQILLLVTDVWTSEDLTHEMT